MTILAKGTAHEITNLGDCVSDEAPADKAALIFVDLDGSHTTLTYADVHRRLSLLQTTLEAHPVAGQVVGVVAGNSADYLLVCLAIMRAGGTACPINWKLADRTVAAIFQDAGIALAICDAEHADKCPDETNIVMIDNLVGSAAASPEGQAPAVPYDPAFVMYTSGSTG
ncbi:MAG: AMP-binding protein, partial [Pseudomonadota bacterium]